jgi:hypothetical protein
MDIRQSITFMVCFTLIIISIVGSVSYYNINDRRLMSVNITDAVAKGIDPLSVRCTYAMAQDIVCVAYASNSKK